MGLLPTAVTFGAAISATERAAKWPGALLLLEDLGRRALQPNVILCSSAVSACEKAAEWQQALGLLAEMQALEVQANTITYNSAISACGASSEWRQSLHLLEEVDAVSMQVDIISFNAAAWLLYVRGRILPFQRFRSGNYHVTSTHEHHGDKHKISATVIYSCFCTPC